MSERGRGGLTRYGRRTIALATALSALAGYVDALGFLSAGSFFVSFMSGNTTRLGIGTAAGTWTYAALAFGLVLAFVSGVVSGTLTNRATGKQHRAAVLLLVSVFLTISVILHNSGHTEFGLAAMCFAMGAENAVLYRDGEASVGLTYMTGALVRLGQQLAGMAYGGPRREWIPYAVLWTGMVAGAATGAFVHSKMSISGLWLAVGAALILAVYSFFSARRLPVAPAGLV